MLKTIDLKRIYLELEQSSIVFPSTNKEICFMFSSFFSHSVVVNHHDLPETTNITTLFATNTAKCLFANGPQVKAKAKTILPMMPPPPKADKAVVTRVWPRSVSLSMLMEL